LPACRRFSNATLASRCALEVARFDQYSHIVRATATRV